MIDTVKSYILSILDTVFSVIWWTGLVVAMFFVATTIAILALPDIVIALYKETFKNDKH